MRSKNILTAGGILAVVLAGALIAQTLDAGAELAIIDRVYKARSDYTKALTELANHYLRVGDVTKSNRATRELGALNSIEQYAYAKDTVGPVVKEPVKVLKYIPEADDYYTDGKIIAESRRKARKDLALRRFAKVLETWPDSDKASAAAYEMANLYAGIYYRDYDLAAKYYKKCYDLDPATLEPALVRAGDMYVKLGRNKDAVTMYKLAVKGSRDVKHKEMAEKALDKLAAQGF